MAFIPRLFVSATSCDLKSHRTAVAATLRKLEAYTEVQDDWPLDYRTVAAMLRRRIQNSDAVIHLVGMSFGAEPANRPPGVPRRSYTHLEYHIARELKKSVYVFLLDPSFPYDLSDTVEDEEKRNLQEAHRAEIVSNNYLRCSPSDGDSLLMEVLALQPLVEKLRTTLSRQRQYMVAGIVIFLIFGAAGVWSLMSENAINKNQVLAISELQKPESPEVKLFKEIQLRRNEQTLLAGGGTVQISYAEALASVANDHGLTPSALRSMLDNFAERTLADPRVDPYERGIAEFHRRNFDEAISLGTAAASAAEGGLREMREKAIDAWLLVASAEEENFKYPNALAAYERALSLCNKHENPLQWKEVAQKVFGTRISLADWSGAESQAMDTLALCEQHFGGSSKEAGSAMNDVGLILQLTNRPTESEVSYKNSLTTLESTVGERHPLVALVLNNLSTLYQDTGRHSKSEPLLRRAIEIDEA